MTETNLPSEASLELPKVHVSAEYILDGGLKTRENQFSGTGKEFIMYYLFLFKNIYDINIYRLFLFSNLKICS